MLDIKYLRQNIELVQKKMDERGQKIDVGRFLDLEAKRRDILQAVEALRNERNSVSKQVGELKKKKEDASGLIAKMGEVSAKIKEYDESLKAIEEELGAFVMIVPNVQHESVPVGSNPEDNAVVRTWGEIPVFNFEPKQHFDLGENLNILDFARGAKITGARFTLYRGAAAQLERAITNFMLDLHTSEHGYTEVFTPFMVNAESMTGTGQLPKFKEDLFKIEGMEYYLIPTAEVPVTNIYRDEILDEDMLPVYFVAYSACFRAEAGSYGKDTRGLIRQHQFNKVEMVKAYAAHEKGALEAVINARAKAMSAQGPEAKASAENQLSQSLKSLFALAEAYPQLRAVEAFNQLQGSLNQIEEALQNARRYYNAVVRDYNAKTQEVPTNFIAGWFNFVGRQFFELTESTQREPPRVQF